MKKILLGLVFLGFITSIHANTSKEYALKGRLVLSAFQCSVVASFLKQEEEHARLFNLGYKEGSSFLKAIEQNKISNADIKHTVPFIVLMSMQGPSNDFMLGRIYESIQVDVFKSIYENYSFSESGEKLGLDIRNINANKMFHDKNCNVLK